MNDEHAARPGLGTSLSLVLNRQLVAPVNVLSRWLKLRRCRLVDGGLDIYIYIYIECGGRDGQLVINATTINSTGKKEAAEAGGAGGGRPRLASP